MPGTPQGRALGIGLARGVIRLMEDMGLAALAEVPLANGRRADVMAIDPKGRVTIVEVKSSPADFRADRKWAEYGPYCDYFYFAVPVDFPQELIPPEPGLIVADRHGGDILRPPPSLDLSGARRKAVLIRFGRLAAARLRTWEDPGPEALQEP